MKLFVYICRTNNKHKIMTTTYNLSYTTTQGVKCMAKGIKFNTLVKWVEEHGDDMNEYRIVQYDNGHARKTTTVKNY